MKSHPKVSKYAMRDQTSKWTTYNEWNIWLNLKNAKSKKNISKELHLHEFVGRVEVSKIVITIWELSTALFGFPFILIHLHYLKYKISNMPNILPIVNSNISIINQVIKIELDISA